MDRFINNLRVLWRADSTIAEIRLRHALARSGINAFAGLMAVFGLLMFELAGYFALLKVCDVIIAALVLGVVNFAIAGILFLIAARRRPGRELELANEIHRSAVEALQADARVVQAEWAMVGRALRHPFDSALPALVVPLANLVLNNLKKPKGEPGAGPGGAGTAQS
jgi:hypothetical protein